MKFPWKKIVKTMGAVGAHQVGINLNDGRNPMLEQDNDVLDGFRDVKELGDFLAMAVEAGVYRAAKRLEKENQE